MATLIGDTEGVVGIDLTDDVSIGSAIHDEVFDNMDEIFTVNKGLSAPNSPIQQQTNMLQTALAPPRMVSLPSMSDVKSPRKRSLNLTPYDSLKELVRSKQRVRTSTKVLDSLPAPRSTSFLHEAFYGQVQEPSAKRAKVSVDRHTVQGGDESALHRACTEGNADEVAKLLKEDRVQSTRSVRVTTTKSVYNFATYKMENRQVEENYTFPLNLAIRAKLDTSTLDAIAKAAPGVLSTKDGDAQECSLSVLFKTMPHDTATADKFLLKNPDCARVSDRKGNTPLHVACQNGAPLDTIRHLVILYPEAVFLHNHHGETPLIIAQRAAQRCSEHVATYLWEKQAESYQLGQS